MVENHRQANDAHRLRHYRCGQCRRERPAGGRGDTERARPCPHRTVTRSAGAVNLLINGDFTINQRGYRMGSLLSSYIYGFDRWKAGGRDTYLNWPTNGLTGVHITRGTLEQIVEAESIDGGSYTLSWRGDARACFNGGPWSESPITVERLPFGQPIRVDFAGGTVGRVKLEPGVIA